MLLRIQAPTETTMDSADIAAVRRGGFGYLAWKYASPEKIQVIGCLTRAYLLPVLQRQGNRPMPIMGSPRFEMGDPAERLAKGESRWFYVTILAKSSWTGYLSFRANLDGVRKEGRVKLAISLARKSGGKV